ncbi:hypothetical protein HYX13_01585 [Candidatus Woesearchaeota archaeon]|nr:hypothetical protein [Candidatus Woesearchaeota archaeon]
MADENNEYEVLPHQLLEDLKYDVEELKKKLTQPDSKTQELVLEMESLKDSLRDLQEVFHKALEQTKGEDVGQTISGLRQKIENVVQQNETIARALLTISDKLDDFMQGKRGTGFSLGSSPGSVNSSTGSFSSPNSPPSAGGMQGMQHQMGMPSLPGPRMAPRPMGGPSGFSGMPMASSSSSSFSGSSLSPVSDLPLPPAPPSGMKRKGLF